MLDAQLGLIGDEPEAEREFLDCLTGDTNVRAEELAEAMIARGTAVGSTEPARIQRLRGAGDQGGR